jgi:hypothetical protein
LPEPLDLRTQDNGWVIKRWVDGSEQEIVDNAYDAWLRHRRVMADGRTIPDQAAFFAGWHALQDWLQFGLGLEGRLSDLSKGGESS